MANFTPLSGLAGGLMIGLSAALLLVVTGRVAGISGILEGAMRAADGVRSWRYAYLAGLPLGVLLVSLLAPGLLPAVELPNSYPVLVLAGLLVGVGARIGGGCTSGHGVCGIPRLSLRSITATMVFMAAAAITVFLTRHVL